MKAFVIISICGVVLFGVNNAGWGQAAMTEVVFPQYMVGKDGSTTHNQRLPVAFRIQLTGLAASSSYRLTAGAVTSADVATEDGAGNYYDATSSNAAKSAGTFSTGDYFTTDGSGNSPEFWIVIQPTGNSRFEPGTSLLLRIGVRIGTGTITRITSGSTFTTLDAAATARTSSTSDDGAFIDGAASTAAAGKYVFTFDNTSGTGRPLTVYIIEDNSITESNTPSFYSTSSGRYGLVTPSNNASGVRRIEARSDNTLFDSSTDADGIWPSGANTVNPAQNSVISITTTDASLPVTLSSFTAILADSGVMLKWMTESEVNNMGFTVYRSESQDGPFLKIGWMDGAGSSAIPNAYHFIDKTAQPGRTYFYYIEDVDFEGMREKSQMIKIAFPEKQRVLIPSRTALFQNYPNPFNPETWLPYQLAEAVPVTIRIYDPKGRIIRTLQINLQGAGSYMTRDTAAHWNGKDNTGQAVGSGIYFYQLTAGDFSAIRKMVIVK